jgi:hypothetical protein
VYISSHIRAIAVGVVAVYAVTTAAAWPRHHGQTVKARFLAASTLVRGTWGPNEDTYFVELHFDRHADTPLVRLVDLYPNEAPPISTSILTSPKTTKLNVRRDPACDRPYGEIYLRAAPGDPMAILSERLAYWPKLDHEPEPTAILPCYRTVRR